MAGSSFTAAEADILPAVLSTLQKFQMLEKGDGVVVGVSGGVDSVALLHLLWRLREEWDLRLYAVHLNHGLRGQEAEADSKLVQKFAQELGVQVTVETADIAAEAAAMGVSEEEAGRERRYALYHRVAREVGARRIAVGHHGNDQAETVLMNLVRGAGLRGLGGIPPVRGQIIRPLSGLQKSQLERYCRWQGLPWREDVSNRNTAYRRNYIRWEILPRLAVVNPGIVGGLMRTAASLREDWQFIQEKAKEAYAAVVEEASARRVILKVGELKTLPVALRKRVLCRAYEQVAGEHRTPGAAGLEQLETLLMGETGRWRLTLPLAIDARVQENVLVLEKEAKCRVKEREVAPHYLEMANSTFVPELNIVINMGVVNETGAWWQDPAFPSPEQLWREEGTWWADMDLDTLRFPLYVRNRRPGDRFQPLGMHGSKKLKDFFIDEKVPVTVRDKIPCIVDAVGIVAVVGLRIAHRVRITADTSRVLRLTVNKTEAG